MNSRPGLAAPPRTKGAARASLAALACALAAGHAGAQTLQSFSNLQPSLALSQVIVQIGQFPELGGAGPAQRAPVGFVQTFAGNFTPQGGLPTNGEILSINASSNLELFNVLGTTYGGDGTHTFAAPNLVGRTVVSAGGAGGRVSTTGGSATVAPVAGQAFSNVQPSLTLQTLIAVSGVFPPHDSPGAATGAYIGELANFTGLEAPSGWMPANGQILSISAFPGLFSIIGTTYGGNGVSTFALPNLQGRTEVGADAQHPLGQLFGQDISTISAAQLPPGGAPIDNDQASFAVNYLIATSGAFPDPDDPGSSAAYSQTTPYLGEITAFAGNFAPQGYAEADGQLLPISAFPELFDILGTTYGGDGVHTFALPDLDGRAIIGAGDGYELGGDYGTAQVVLQDVPGSGPQGGEPSPTPEPSAWALMILGFGGAGAMLRRPAVRNRAFRPALPTGQS
jgi:microcystin-dependent protein